MTEQEYRAAGGINKSTLWEMRKSPAHYKYLLEHPTEDTAALHFGRALHSAVLTPTAFKRDFRKAPDVDKRTKAGRETYTAWKASLPDGVEEISTEDAQTIKDMVKAIRGNAVAMKLLKGTRREKPLFWTDSGTGLLCKCRIDALSSSTAVDLKTTTDASSRAFQRDALKYGYHLQAAHYLNGIEAVTGNKPDWYFIAVEKSAPYAVHVFKATDQFIEYGDYMRDELLEAVKRCTESGEWSGYAADNLDAPEWAIEEV